MRRRSGGSQTPDAVSASTWSSTTMRHSSGRSSPAAAEMIVDLPAPDGPNSTVTPGVGTSNAMSICTDGKR